MGRRALLTSGLDPSPLKELLKDFVSLPNAATDTDQDDLKLDDLEVIGSFSSSFKSKHTIIVPGKYYFHFINNIYK